MIYRLLKTDGSVFVDLEAPKRDDDAPAISVVVHQGFAFGFSSMTIEDDVIIRVYRGRETWFTDEGPDGEGMRPMRGMR